MRLLKRLDIYLLKTFLGFFLAALAVCLFILLMQFTWRWLEELISKGVEGAVLMQFFFYTSLTLIPMALPLALLLGSLLTFGSIGENRELLAMKAAGISLLRIMRPLFCIVVLLSIGSFFFQNNVFPVATRQLAVLLWSMRQKNPEMDIPQGRFYNAIPGYNLFVEHKNGETGMLYNVMIYSQSGNYQNTEITLSDSALLQSTADKKNLKLTLFRGERFKNLNSQSGSMMKANVPYMRETFLHEEVLIPFDTNLDMMSGSAFSHNAQTKSLQNIVVGIDSLNQRIDSTGHATYDMALRGPMNRSLNVGKGDSLALLKRAHDRLPFDSLMNTLSQEQRGNVLKHMQNVVAQQKAEYEFRSLVSEEDNRMLRVHKIEWNKKFTLSVACILFFFIGAPLGAIIGKGGLGIPTIVSVIIFIAYYLVNNSGEKMARSGNMEIVIGVWISSCIMAPFGLWLTRKANSDSAMFNAEAYRRFFMRLFGLRETRKLNPKDVIIYDPDYDTLPRRMESLSERVLRYARRKRLKRTPNYLKLFFAYHTDTEIQEISRELEALVSEMHNSRDHAIIGLLNEIPTLSATAHTRPFNNRRRNIAAGILLPVGLFFYFRIWRYRLRLARDTQQITRIFKHIIRRIKDKGHGSSSEK